MLFWIAYRLYKPKNYGLVAINMPLELKHNSGPTRTENSLAYHIPASSVDYQKNSFFYRTVRDLRYSTSFGERESRPFREEPETFISILISTTHAPGAFCYALSRHVHSHWSGVFDLLKCDRIAKQKKKPCPIRKLDL